MLTHLCKKIIYISFVKIILNVRMRSKVFLPSNKPYDGAVDRSEDLPTHAAVLRLLVLFGHVIHH